MTLMPASGFLVANGIVGDCGAREVDGVGWGGGGWGEISDCYTGSEGRGG